MLSLNYRYLCNGWWFVQDFYHTWIVPLSKCNSCSSPLLQHSYNWCSKTNWWSFAFEFSEGFCRRNFSINIITKYAISFNGESWIHSFNNSLVFCYTFFQSDLLVKGKGFYAKMQCLCDVSYSLGYKQKNRRTTKRGLFLFIISSQTSSKLWINKFLSHIHLYLSFWQLNWYDFNM